MFSYAYYLLSTASGKNLLKMGRATKRRLGPWWQKRFWVKNETQKWKRKIKKCKTLLWSAQKLKFLLQFWPISFLIMRSEKRKVDISSTGSLTQHITQHADPLMSICTENRSAPNFPACLVCSSDHFTIASHLPRAGHSSVCVLPEENIHLLFSGGLVVVYQSLENFL